MYEFTCISALSIVDWIDVSFADKEYPEGPWPYRLYRSVRSA